MYIHVLYTVNMVGTRTICIARKLIKLYKNVYLCTVQFTFCGYARKLTKLYKNVYICTGPLYLPRKEASDGKMYVKYEVKYKKCIRKMGT